MRIIFELGKIILKLLFVIAGAVAAIVFNKECADGIGKGLVFCASVLIPSLYIFMSITAYMIKSGVSDIISKPFYPLSRVMGIPKEAVSAVVLSMIGGYPIGAGCVELLFEQGKISESEAVKTAYIAVAAGPGFIINYVGRSLLDSPEAGNILLASQIIAVIITGLIVGKTVVCSPPPSRSKSIKSSENALVGSVMSAAGSAFGMCAMVVVFSALIEVISSVSDKNTAESFSAVLEVTTGCNNLAGKYPLYVTAFIIGFGGLSVHFQIFSALKDIGLNKALFILFRIVEGIISAVSTYILLMICPIKTAVFSSAEIPLSAAGSATIAGSGALILASVCFIGSINTRLRRIGYVRNSGMDRL